MKGLMPLNDRERRKEKKEKKQRSRESAYDSQDGDRRPEKEHQMLCRRVI